MQQAGIVDTDSVLSQVEELIGEIAPLNDRSSVLESTCEFLRGIDGVGRFGAMTTNSGDDEVWIGSKSGKVRPLQLDGQVIPPHQSAKTGEILAYRFENPAPAPEWVDEEAWNATNRERFEAGDVDMIALPLRGTTGPIGAFWIAGDRPEGLEPGFAEALEVLGSVVAMTIEKIESVDRAAQQLEEMTAVHRKLEASNRDFQSFAQMASSDLQDPLRKIISFGDRLERSAVDELSEREVDYLVRIHSASDRMQRLINDLLTFSSVHTSDTEHESVDLELVMVDVMSDLEVAIADSAATVKIGELPTVTGSPTQLRQLLQNLVGNAIKFRAEGVPPRIEVALANATGSFYVVTVSDNGIGFDGKFLEKIFRPFQRLHGSSDYAGSGIGLSVCKRIVTRHRGWLTAHSEPGEGATFVIHLPVPSGSHDRHGASS